MLRHARSNTQTDQISLVRGVIKVGNYGDVNRDFLFLYRKFYGIVLWYTVVESPDPP